MERSTAKRQLKLVSQRVSQAVLEKTIPAMPHTRSAGPDTQADCMRVSSVSPSP